MKYINILLICMIVGCSGAIVDVFEPDRTEYKKKLLYDRIHFISASRNAFHAYKSEKGVYPTKWKEVEYYLNMNYNLNYCTEEKLSASNKFIIKNNNEEYCYIISEKPQKNFFIYSQNNQGLPDYCADLDAVWIYFKNKDDEDKKIDELIQKYEKKYFFNEFLKTDIILKDLHKIDSERVFMYFCEQISKKNVSEKKHISLCWSLLHMPKIKAYKDKINKIRELLVDCPYKESKDLLESVLKKMDEKDEYESLFW